MSKRPSLIPERLLQAVKNRTFVPFVGSGLSKQSDPNHFPSWLELLDRFITKAKSHGYLDTTSEKNLRSLLKRGRHLMVAESLRTKVPVDYYHDFLETQFAPTNAKPSKAHQLLLSLRPRFFITTNYDRLIENAYAKAAHKAMTVLDYSDSGAVQRKIQDEKQAERPFLYKIHGDIEDTSSIILTENDYRKLLYDEMGYQTVLASIFIHFVVLFIGFSLADDELMIHLARLRHALKGANFPDYVLFSDKDMNPIEIERFRNDFGLEVIFYPHDATHSGLLTFLKALRNKSAIKST